MHMQFRATSWPDYVIKAIFVLLLQDKQASDSMDFAIKLMGLSGLMRQAIKLIKGIKLTQEGNTFTMGVFSVFSWFKASRVIISCLTV